MREPNARGGSAANGAAAPPGQLGVPRFDGQGWWLGQATCVMPFLSVAVSNSSGVT
jgi:hypothetical protein